jgi:hypothetical protein
MLRVEIPLVEQRRAGFQIPIGPGGDDEPDGRGGGELPR